MSVLEGVYPFSTQDGKAIPLDIIKPAGLLMKDFTTSYSSIALPAGSEVVVLLTTEPCLLVQTGLAANGDVINPAALADNTYLEKAVVVPAGTAVTVALSEDPVFIRGLSANGTCYIQCIEKWAGLALAKQYTRKG